MRLSLLQLLIIHGIDDRLKGSGHFIRYQYGRIDLIIRIINDKDRRIGGILDLIIDLSCGDLKAHRCARCIQKQLITGFICRNQIASGIQYIKAFCQIVADDPGRHNGDNGDTAHKSYQLEAEGMTELFRISEAFHIIPP